MVINHNGDCIQNCPEKGEVFESVDEFYGGMAKVKKNNKYGFIDFKDKKLVIPLIYDNALNFNTGVAPVKKGTKWGVIDKTGKEVLSFKYDRIQPNSGYLRLYKDGKVGLWSKRYGLFIPVEFEEIRVGNPSKFVNGFKNGQIVQFQNGKQIAIPFDKIRTSGSIIYGTLNGVERKIGEKIKKNIGKGNVSVITPEKIIYKEYQPK